MKRDVGNAGVERYWKWLILTAVAPRGLLRVRVAPGNAISRPGERAPRVHFAFEVEWQRAHLARVRHYLRVLSDHRCEIKLGVAYTHRYKKIYFVYVKWT